MKLLLNLLKIHLKSLYFFIKIFTLQKKQVFFLSRQYDEISLNYKFIMKELDKKNIKYIYICKKVNETLNDAVRIDKNKKNIFIKFFTILSPSIKYYFNLIKQMKYIAKSKVVIVDGYNLPVSLLSHKKGTKVIQMWHALGAIKKFGYQSVGYKDGINVNTAKILKMHNNYDYVISGSTYMNKFFSEAFKVPIEKILPIGTPTVDYIREKNEKIKKNIFNEYPQLKNKINILYSPTFRNDNRDETSKIIDKIDFNKCNLILTFHPKIKEKHIDGRVICINRDKFSTFDMLKVCDYVITDYSALTIDAIIAEKKVLLYVYDYEKYKKENGLNIELLDEFPKLAYKDIDKLLNVIYKNNYDNEQYEKLKNICTNGLSKNCTKENLKLIERCMNDE